jgi:hypothetical protein
MRDVEHSEFDGLLPMRLRVVEILISHYIGISSALWKERVTLSRGLKPNTLEQGTVSSRQVEEFRLCNTVQLGN